MAEALELTEDELFWLKYYNASPDDIFDARGMTSKKQYHDPAKAEGKELVLVLSTCKDGHRIKCRNGHCFFCTPTCLKFRKRYSETAWVYIAYSKSENLHKIGMSSNLKKRHLSLKSGRSAYAMANDWVVEAKIYVDNSGTIENEVMKELDPFSVEAFYEKDNTFHRTKEIFDCTFKQAYEALEKVCTRHDIDTTKIEFPLS